MALAFRKMWPAIAITCCGMLGLAGLALGALFPWYKYEQVPNGDDNCSVTVSSHLFYTWVDCGKCSSDDCKTVYPNGKGIDVDWTLLVFSAAWVSTIVSFVFIFIGTALAWVRSFGGKMRWLARLMLAIGFFFNIAAFLSFISFNAALARDTKELTGFKCDGGICKHFIGHNDIFEYWGPGAGWISSVVAGGMTLFAVILSLMLPGARKFDEPYTNIYD